MITLISRGHRSTKFIVLVLFLVSILHVLSNNVVDARGWSPSNLPNPQQDSKAVCKRQGLKSSICDVDGFLSQSEGDTIDGIINFINKRSNGFTPPECKETHSGPQIAVSIVDKMQRIIGEDKETTAYEFAKSLHDNWGVGNKQCQDGIVLFISISDRAIGISIGQGVKSVFTDAMVPSFFSAVGAKLKTREYGQAVIYSVTLIGNILSGKSDQVLSKYSSSSSNSSSSFPFFLIFLGVFFGVNACSKRRLSTKHNRYIHCKQILQKMDKDRSKASRSQYVSTSCPICLEDFEDNKNSENENQQNDNDNPAVIDNENDEHIRLTTSLGSSKTSPSASTSISNKQKDKNKASDKQQKDKKKSRKYLSCGHSFHEDCVLDWFTTPGNPNATCPICRKSVMSNDDNIPNTNTNNNNSNNSMDQTMPSSTSSTRYPVGWDGYDDEYRFRVHRARYYYPDFITWSMLNNWESDRHNLNQQMSSNTAFTAVDPVVVANSAARASGGGGSSFSFGGGSSMGGGGGGGSW